MSSRARNKLHVKQVESLKQVGMYSDGGGLYLRIRESGRSWFFVGTLRGKRITLGLGTALDVTLAKARERAAEARLLIIDYAPGGLSLSNLEGRKARSEKVQIALRKVASNPANAILKIRLISDLKAPFPRRER